MIQEPWECVDCLRLNNPRNKLCQFCTPNPPHTSVPTRCTCGKLFDANPKEGCWMNVGVPYCSEVCAARGAFMKPAPTELPIVPLQPVAARHDSGKPELSHVDVFPRAQEGVALNAAYGASKYDLWNFLKGAKNSLESYNCARRHMSKWFNGEDMVPDAVAAGFNVHHIDAAIWNLMRLREELETFPERDNRPPRPKKDPSDDKCVNSDWCKKCREPDGI